MRFSASASITTSESGSKAEGLFVAVGAAVEIAAEAEEFLFYC